ncbi:MAG TPA: trypsin-like serine protease [Polyangiaceae bacterium]|nr:trypsin-like serine protease [Polyangiaceae bacterium]
MSGTDRCWHLLNLEGSHLTLAFTSGLCIALGACSGPEPSELDAQATSALIVGTLSPAESDAVVFVRANHDDGVFDDCTGTLVSPSVVITAKHCVTLVQPGKFVCKGAGTLVENGQGAGLFGAKIEPSRIEIHVGTAPDGGAMTRAIATFASESGDACHDDIAALVLESPIQQDSYPPLRAVRPTVIGERVRLVGYGTVGHGTLIERREAADVRVLDVGRDDGVNNPNATTPARSFVIGGGTACFGDSGGPALSMDTGALVGVYSRISGDCFAVESRNTFILASSFSALFARAFELAGEEPQIEPAPAGAPEPVGAGGMGGTTAVVALPLEQTAAGSGGDASIPTTARETVASAEPSRHAALHCSLAPSKCGGQPNAVPWLVLALAVFSRRRFARGPF